MTDKWENRIVGTDDVAPDQLLAHPSNWRVHSKYQRDALRDVVHHVGYLRPVTVNKRTGMVVDGHLRVSLAIEENQATIPVEYVDLSPEEEAVVLATIDQIAGLAGRDDEKLHDLVNEINMDDFPEGALKELLMESLGDEANTGLTDPDDVPEPAEEPVSVEGDVWILGNHRLMCGNSTNGDNIEMLMHGEKAQLLHADPPYGMGKEADGVANDNLYSAKLDAFQMDWWAGFRPFIEDNASAYIWGNAPDLWRLWYSGGLGSSEKIEMRNEIVWDKKNIPGRECQSGFG